MAAQTSSPPNRIALSQAGNLHLNGGNLYDSGEVSIPVNCIITNAASTANIALVTYQLVDGRNAATAVVSSLDIWLSDANTGIGLTNTTSSGAVAAGTSGTDLAAITSKKAIRAITDASGKYILSITDNAKTHFYPCCSIPLTGKVVVGAQLTNTSYG